MPESKFIAGEPALLIGRTLVISDLHLGIEHDFYRSGIRMPSQTEKLVKRIDDLIKKTKAKGLIIIGDVKHKIPGTSFQEEREIPGFFNYFSGKIKTEIVMGNHDPGIEKLLPREVGIHPMQGFLLGDAYLCHGHAWPAKDIEKASLVVLGHNQPLIELRDKLGYSWTEKAWIVSEMDSNKLGKRYKGLKSAPKLIIMPAFNDLAGGIRFNREENFMGPLVKAAKLKSAKAYLLDGTYMGKLGKLMVKS